MKKCPWCGQEYPDEVSLCTTDQSSLESCEATSQEAEATGALLTAQPANPFVAAVFPERIGRLSYFLRQLLMTPLFYLSFFSMYWFPPVMTVVSLVVVVGYFYGYVVMPRLRDFGLPDLAIVLFFIPILNIVPILCLMFGPQDYWQTLRRKTHRTMTPPDAGADRL